MKKSPVLQTVLLSTLMTTYCSIALANDSEELADSNTVDLESITVTGTWEEQRIGDYVGSLSVISEEQISNRLINNIQDLIRYEPGVSIEGNGRFGISGFNIRGLGGDRVLIMVDGVPIADEFSFGPNLSSGRNIVDVESVKSVEILKGPASSIYGSDALAGVVQFVSKSPYDYIRNGNDYTPYLLFKAGYQSSDSGSLAQLNGALGNDAIAGFVSVTTRAANELKTNGEIGGEGPLRTEADSQHSGNINVLGKLEFNMGPEQSLILTADIFSSDVESDIESASNSQSRGTLIQDSFGDDQQKRVRLSADYKADLNSGLADNLDVKVYWQQSETEQDTLDFRFGTTLLDPATPVQTRRTRHSEFQQDIFGARVVLAKTLRLQDSQHQIHYGINFSDTDSESMREGATETVNGGISIPEFSVFPVRDFPISSTKKSAVFLSDQITLGETGWEIIPGIRYDRFDHSTLADELYLAGSGGVEPENYDDDNLALKLGVSKAFAASHKWYIQYAEGFRIPAYDDVNVAFTNFAGGYTTLSAPDLSPETSASVEVGVKGQFAATQYELAVYRNVYEDFIESLAMKGFNPATGLLEFQATNIDDVEISGIEGKLSSYIHDQVLLNIGFSLVDSEDTATGNELDSVSPDTFYLGIDWQAFESFNISAVATHARDKNWSDETWINANAYTIVDVYANYEITDNAQLNVGIFNLLDKTYWHSGNLIGRTDPATAERFSQPGRNMRVNVRYQF
ncbi:MAG: TonB-dependent hemoglobin/transferrin/lactoferrin family receptor [Aestuariibacter sp.]